tara:strand:+ start:1905 stop:2441 length:537 start_codon:yes stop_codon:yes gene_type:complete
MPKKKIKKKPNKNITKQQLEKLLRVIYKRIRSDGEGFKIWANSDAEWCRLYKEKTKITSILTKDIELKHKHIEDLKKFNRAIVDKYEDKYVEFDTANKELSKENTRLIKDNIELTRAYNSLAHLGKFAEEEGIDIKKHNGKLPENSKNYKFSQKHTLLESGKVRSEYKLTPKKGKKDE